MSKNSLIEKIKRGELIGVVECSLEVTEEMYPYFEEFPQIFKNCEIGRDEIGEHMKEFAERNKLLHRPEKSWLPLSSLNDDQLSHHFCYFIWKKVFVVLRDVFLFLQHTPRRCFESLPQNLVDSRREGYPNKEWTVVDQNMKLIGNSSYGYQIMDCSRHTNSKYVEGDQIDTFFNNRFFKTTN